MLKASLMCNPDSLILFSSKHPRHIQNNVAVLEDTLAAEPALRLYALVRSEVVQDGPSFSSGEDLANNGPVITGD